MTSLNHRFAACSKVGAVAVLAAGLLAGSVAPSAAESWPDWQSHSTSATNPQVGFHRHFWRGSQLSHAPVQAAEMTALSDEPEMDEAVSYCASRFRSYDPATGTYLGYDGNEHACP